MCIPIELKKNNQKISFFYCCFFFFFPNHTCLVSQEKEKWPLGFTKMEAQQQP